MELQQLRYFLEVAKNQHVTRTAQQLHISQPSLTQAIHRLEHELGVPLFQQKGRGIVLTEYGKYLQSRLESLLGELDALPEQLRTMAALSHETIHLNVLAASALVSDAVISYRARNNHLSFQLMQSTESELYDIGVDTKLFYQPSEDEGDSCYVCTERIFLAVPANGKYKGRKTIRLEEVCNEGFISLLGSRQLRWICDKFCQHAGFSPRIVFESDNPATVRNMIGVNMGVGFWPEFSWGKIESDHVLLLDIEEPLCQRDIIVSLKRNKGKCEHVEDFFHFLVECFNNASNRS